VSIAPDNQMLDAFVVVLKDATISQTTLYIKKQMWKAVVTSGVPKSQKLTK
jgi:hypothetical protein